MTDKIIRRWATIEQHYLDDENFVQLEFRWERDREGFPLHKVYHLLSQVEGVIGYESFEIPDDLPHNNNKRNAYDAYWAIEEKLLAL